MTVVPLCNVIRESDLIIDYYFEMKVFFFPSNTTQLFYFASNSYYCVHYLFTANWFHFLLPISYRSYCTANPKPENVVELNLRGRFGCTHRVLRPSSCLNASRAIRPTAAFLQPAFGIHGRGHQPIIRKVKAQHRADNSRGGKSVGE